MAAFGNPMFHMDQDYMWRWYITDAHGQSCCMSAREFFHYEDARSDFDAVRTRLSP